MKNIGKLVNDYLEVRAYEAYIAYLKELQARKATEEDVLGECDSYYDEIIEVAGDLARQLLDDIKKEVDKE